MTAFVVSPPDWNNVHVQKDMAGNYGVKTGPGVVLPPLDLIYHALTLKAEHDLDFVDLQAFPDETDRVLARIAEHRGSTVVILITATSLGSAKQ